MSIHSFNIGCAFPLGIQIKIQIGQISELNSNFNTGETDFMNLGKLLCQHTQMDIDTKYTNPARGILDFCNNKKKNKKNRNTRTNLKRPPSGRGLISV